MVQLRKHAEIGIVHFMAFPQVMKGEGPILETLKKILADDYFDVIEVTRIKDERVAREAAKLCVNSHITVAFGAQPVLLGSKLNLNALEENERRKAIDAIRSCFDQAALLNAVGVAVLSGPWIQGQEQQAQDALVASLMELSKEAEKFKLKLVLEVFDDSIDKKALVGKAAVAAAVGRAVRAECDNFGLMHDLSHLPLLGESPREALEPIKDMLVHAHLGNAVVADSSHPAYGDQHPRFGIPGGANDVAEVAEFLEVLYDIGYLGGDERRIISFEVKPMPGEDSEFVIAGAKRVLNEAVLRL